MAAVVVWLLLQSTTMADGRTSDLRQDEEIVFFPALAHRVRGGQDWECEIRGCVYEPERRRLALGLLHEALQLSHVEMTAAKEAMFNKRARLFMVDHEGGKKVVVRIGEAERVLGKSRRDGQFTGVVRLTDKESRAIAGKKVQFQAVLPVDDPRQFVGQIYFVEEHGITVISDMDDTMKVSQVRDRKALLRRTFMEPFEPVPGTAEVYRAWADKSGAQFCYVSASPWQLFVPLSEFVHSNGFPAGAFTLKTFRWQDESFLKLFEGPERYKPAVIEPLLKRFPRRQFVLVGDSGEKDPEIYAELARRYPSQIARILIRDVTDEPADAERYRTVFRGLPRAAWQVFHTATEIAGSCPSVPGR
jgi:phosphatidate phosphatase APP1